MRTRTTSLLLAASAMLAPQAWSQSKATLTGSIVGVVSNALGIPQMGAAVTLFNRVDRQVTRALTDETGAFQFDSLPADLYTVRVTLASFLPAVRSNIGVQPGIRRIMQINLTGALSTIELVYSLPVGQGMMSDDWKWALRGSLASRPILRILGPDLRDPLRHMRSPMQGMFTETRGMLKLSAGDETPAPTLGSQPDLGTAFALATSFLGANQLSISGNLGYGAQSGNPAAGFRTTYSRQMSGNRTPELSVTMRQLFVGGRMANQQASLPELRTLSVGMTDRFQATDALHITYGATLESVTFLRRLNYFSPFAKLSYDLEDLGVVELGFSSGLPPAELYHTPGQNPHDPEHQQRLNGLSMFPRVSVRDGRAQLQRAQNFEVGFRRKYGSRTFTAGAYRETMTNTALLATGADGAFSAGEWLPDLFSTASILNAGRFQSMGYMASLQQAFDENWTLTVAYGSSGVLEAGRDTLASNDASELRSVLQTKRRSWATTKLAGYVRPTGTRFSSSYQFVNGQALTPGHFYMTQQVNPAQGWNVNVRQPLPSPSGVPGKLEATAEVRNILAQGYQPMTLGDGRGINLVHSPRALRGGLAFIF